MIEQLYWNHTSTWMFSCKYAPYFQNIFLTEHLQMTASAEYLGKILFKTLLGGLLQKVLLLTLSWRRYLIIQKPVHWFAQQINVLVSIWWGSLSINWLLIHQTCSLINTEAVVQRSSVRKVFLQISQNFAKFLRKLFFIEHFWWLLLLIF